MEHLDVLIVGAGLSGVGAAYHLQTHCPTKRYAILESRAALGGTWDLFRYPGIRSDSDMYTLGHSFRPWTNPKAIADGPAILSYVRETAEHYGIDKHIRYERRVERASWSTRDARWTIDVRDMQTGEVGQLSASFLFMCAGYYDYDAGYTPEWPGTSRFRGQIVHPQKWTSDIDYANKRVVVIGSGATAVTLVPELSKKAAHVTMLQRSPTYIVTVPERDRIADWMRQRLPGSTAYKLTRFKNVLLSMAFYQYCRRFPERAKRMIVGEVKKHVRGKVDLKHFTPSYYPWDQRVCLVPDGDLFNAVRDGQASIVTDRIDTFTERGIRLASGAELEADIVVTATGLKLKFLGGMQVVVDGQVVESRSVMTYKGMMCSDIPNMAFAIGYTNASWTLKCDLTSEYVCRLLNHMDKHGFKQCVPRRNPAVKEEALIDFTSGYVERAKDLLPRQGSVAPWKLHQNYALDTVLLRHGSVADGVMEFS